MSDQGNDWSQWGELWREQPEVDVARLQRTASRKLWRMRTLVTLEIAGSIVACAQCVRLAMLTTGRWHLWSMASLVFVLALQWLYLHVRRGTWRASGDDVHSLLKLTLQRAAAGIRLAKLNIWATLAWVAVSVVVGLPELEPARWQADPRLKSMLVLQVAVNAPLMVGIFAFYFWYIRRQRARIVRIHDLLKPDV
ncbi:hypothetical protein [Dyella sp. C11]|uniref:hypothetical protein n=1 Tax=Dyella sp. C11 TaxID=2126991 RepID=UPI0013008ACD|nr:hypothetical protein [Dyella sp. C11]